jgi:hypothetical protein
MAKNRLPSIHLNLEIQLRKPVDELTGFSFRGDGRALAELQFEPLKLKIRLYRRHE